MDENQMETLLKATITLLLRVSRETAKLADDLDTAEQLRQSAESLESALGSLRPNPQGQL